MADGSETVRRRRNPGAGGRPPARTPTCNLLPVYRENHARVTRAVSRFDTPGEPTMPNRLMQSFAAATVMLAVLSDRRPGPSTLRCQGLRGGEGRWQDNPHRRLCLVVPRLQEAATDHRAVGKGQASACRLHAGFRSRQGRAQGARRSISEHPDRLQRHERSRPIHR